MCGQWVDVGGGLVAASREISFGAVVEVECEGFGQGRVVGVCGVQG